MPKKLITEVDSIDDLFKNIKFTSDPKPNSQETKITGKLTICCDMTLAEAHSLEVDDIADLAATAIRTQMAEFIFGWLLQYAPFDGGDIYDLIQPINSTGQVEEIKALIPTRKSPSLNHLLDEAAATDSSDIHPTRKSPDHDQLFDKAASDMEDVVDGIFPTTEEPDVYPDDL